MDSTAAHHIAEIMDALTEKEVASVTRVLGEKGVSIKSVVQRGLGASARLVMVTHPVLESRLRIAVREMGEFEFLRSEPRMIRVIEEEFV